MGLSLGTALDRRHAEHAEGTSLEPGKLTILGSSPAWTNPGGAGSGYLLRYDSTAVQIEAGSGTFGRLREVMPVAQLDAVIISHVHGDHFLDLVPLCYGLRYAKLRDGAPLPVYVPPGCIQFLSDFANVLNGEPDFFSGTFQLREYPTNKSFTIGSMTFIANRVQHYIASHALRCDLGDGFVFSGDTAPCDELVSAARGAGTLLCEAALTNVADDAPNPTERGHLTPGEAAQIAHRAGVRRLILTHFRTDVQDYDTVTEQARAHFAGEIVVAREKRTYTIP
jgi:ribonuclease BN (tRNA processing enzyme)